MSKQDTHASVKPLRVAQELQLLHVLHNTCPDPVEHSLIECSADALFLIEALHPYLTYDDPQL